MKTIFKPLLLIPVCLILTACATVPQRQPLTIQNRTAIKSDKVLLNTTQHAVVMQHNDWFASDMADPYAPMDSGAIVHQNEGYNPNAGLIGGLIVAGIHHNYASEGAKEMVSVNTALGGFNYVDYFNSELKHKVATIPWLKVRKQSVQYNVMKSEEKSLASSKENTVMLIGTTYALNSTFNQLEVVAYVKLAEKLKKSSQAKTLYANNFYFIYRLHKSASSAKAKNKAIWVKENAALLKTKLKDAAGILSGLIAADLKNPSVSPYKNVKKLVTVRGVDGFSFKGKLIKHEKGYDVISLVTSGNHSGHMYVVNNNDLRA